MTTPVFTEEQKRCIVQALLEYRAGYEEVLSDAKEDDEDNSVIVALEDSIDFIGGCLETVLTTEAAA